LKVNPGRAVIVGLAALEAGREVSIDEARKRLGLILILHNAADGHQFRRIRAS